LPKSSTFATLSKACRSFDCTVKRQADGSFKEISWAQAIQEIADQLVHIRDTFGGTAFASVGAVRVII
jgi:predicted molibdopterin-dependent oxidoreductase YjgC